MLKGVFDRKNASKILLDGLEAAYDDDVSYLVPKIVIHFYYFLLAAGAVANCYLIFLVVRVIYHKYMCENKVNNILVVLFFIPLCDIGTLATVAPFEVSVLNRGCAFSGLWSLSSDFCRFFLGMEALFNTGSIYLLAILGFTVVGSLGRPLSAGEKGVIIPIALSWVISCSLSVPLLVRGGTVSPRIGLTLCTWVNHAELVQVLFLFFRIVVPSLLLLTAAIFILVRLCDAKMESYAYPRLVIALSAMYGLLSLHRYVFTVMYAILPGDFRQGPEAFRSPPLANVANSHLASLVFSMMHYFSSVLRPVFIILFLKDFWKWKHSSVPSSDRGTGMNVVSYNSEETLL